MQLAFHSTAIGDLLFRSRPSNITHFVMSVIVDSVNTVLGAGSRPECRYEILDRGEVELNAAPTVIGKPFVTWILAAISRGVVDFVLFVTGVSVFREGLCGNFRLQTSAGERDALTETCPPNQPFFATDALAMPERASLPISSDITEHGQAGEGLSRKIDKGFVFSGCFVDGFGKVKVSHSLLRSVDCGQAWGVASTTSQAVSILA